MENSGVQSIYVQLEAGLELAKCRKCGCMAETLDHLTAALPAVGVPDSQLLLDNVQIWRAQLQPVQYACLGCEHCFPAVAQNALATAFPEVELGELGCDFQVRLAGWPPVVGEYFVLDPAAPVAVSTLANVELAELLARKQPDGLALVGKTETENIGLDKIIKNVITDPAIRFLILTGQDSTGHQTGATLRALAENGVDDRRRVIGSPGKRPVLRNVSAAEIAAFRRQVQVIDLIGCTDPVSICTRIEALAQSQVEDSCGCCSCSESAPPVSMTTQPIIVAPETRSAVRLDQVGYFVIVPLAERGLINVEHYDYNHTLLRVVEGSSARALCALIVDNGWVTEQSHAAYLGRELAKAELSLKYGFKYVQDGA